VALIDRISHLLSTRLHIDDSPAWTTRDQFLNQLTYVISESCLSKCAMGATMNFFGILNRANRS
jgi:hypothetical protein